ncbi:glutamine amidotransferase class-I domain protein [Reticulomyxa filosa]|uniref:Glutamine amidotransferase class-I domain protein n=1 Tax=Reticulomyxa filosa TaxID=46433 RepID=X6N2B4_RETFI|nr:glutamine amidotransferase class-I domain protein [Reticulomyxa filosa]|eukprot:ETO20380.1 glutamine amidotransferase class-I domain protein [Reticulomyxa filosa]
MYDAIIILGGNPGVYEEDRFPWLRAEKHFLRRGIYDGVPMLAICLGCQLLAECTGGKVFKGTKGAEIGFKKWEWLEHSDEDATGDRLIALLKHKQLDEMIVLFHQDTFDLPYHVETKHGFEKVYLLAKTNLYNTFFKLGKNTYGFQGHPELKPEFLKVWCQAGWGDMCAKSSALVQETISHVDKHFDKISVAGDIILNMWVDMVFAERVPAVEKSHEFEHYVQHVLLPTARKSRRQSRQSMSLSLSEFRTKMNQKRTSEFGDSDSEIDQDVIEQNQRKIFEEMAFF